MATFKMPVQFEKPLQEPVNLSVILADAQGNIIQQSPVDEKGDASFDEAFLKRGNLQVVVLPDTDDSLEGVTHLQQLERFRPYISSIDWRDGNRPVIKPIPPIFTEYWLLRFCRVLGRLTKTYIIGNNQVPLPVCKARVNICEVDKIFWLIRKIPDPVILRIPELFRVAPKINIPKPNVLINPQITRPNILVRPANTTPVAEPIIKLEPAIAARFNTTNIPVLRNELVNNFKLLIPHFCRIPWLWPYFYRCDKIKTTYTDENGRFDTNITYFTNGDKPDIYIWVECLINGVWETVYRPAVACNTRWDYVCGSEINISITDPRVTSNCGPVLGGEAVWIRTIGNFSVRDVLQTSDNTPIQGVPFERKGLFRYGADHRSPFATTATSAKLHFSIIFGSGLPLSGAKYFRWMCRKTHNEAMVPESGADIALTANIHRPYLVERMEGVTKHFDVRSVLLGPFTVNSKALYLIPPINPVGFEGITDSVGWMSMDVLTTDLDTRTLAGDGLYEFWLEIFDQAGNRVNPPQSFFQVPTVANFNSSETAPAEYFGVCNGMNAFKMVVRVDSLNNKTVAEIHPVRLTSGPGGPYKVSNPCGFLDYSNGGDKNISIPFKAWQANNFADFSFSVGRGNAGTGAYPTVAGISGMVIGDAGRYVRDVDGVYMPDDAPDLEFSPDELMQTCAAGGRAAFTQSLYVNALHVDGYRQLDELDSSASAAFALSKLT